MSTHILASSGPTFLDRLADRLARRIAGPAVRFTDPGVTPPDAGAAAGPGPLSGPAAAASMSTRPGAGGHANDCAYLDDPWHRCVTESGQPSNLVCHATVVRERLLPFSAALCVVCHTPTTRLDQICDSCAQTVA